MKFTFSIDKKEQNWMQILIIHLENLSKPIPDFLDTEFFSWKFIFTRFTSFLNVNPDILGMSDETSVITDLKQSENEGESTSNLPEDDGSQAEEPNNPAVEAESHETNDENDSSQTGLDKIEFIRVILFYFKT